MKSNYDLDWLIKTFESGAALEFVYFWGHTSKRKDLVDQSCLSQWFNSPFTLGGIVYKTAEHWMMAQKALLFNDHSRFESIIQCETPKEAKALGREVPLFDYEMWREKRNEIAWLGNIHKFNQNPLLAEFLLKTEDKILAEASPTDKIWGIGLRQEDPNVGNIYAWPGQNLLGFALMEVREFLCSFGHFRPLENTSSPPWIVYPNIDPEYMFPRMGGDDYKDYLTSFDRYYCGLSERDRTIYQLTHPVPRDWKDYYRWPI
jgi:ribA/ribD-fused uncharacterized protein